MDAGDELIGDAAAGPVDASHVMALEAQHLVPVYRRAPVVFVRGQGAHLWDAGGRRYLDFVSGIGVAVLGHGHPALAEAIADQARSLIHTSNLYFHALQGRAAARLAALAGLPRAFFCNSGAEAVEAALKFARRYWFSQGRRDRTRIVALDGAFSGRTFGALSVTAGRAYREPFEPLLPGVAFVPPGDVAALEAAVDDRTAAVIVEPIQGEGGVRPLPPDYAAALARVCRASGALLIADEVQSGLGRTGRPFHFQALGLAPDLVAVGKALGSGVPIAATLASEPVAAALAFGDHGSTYGGNPLATRAALCVLEAIFGGGGLLAHVQRVGPAFGTALGRLAARHPLVVEARGAGLMRGLELRVDAAPVADRARARGLLVNRTAERVVRLLPPFIVTEADIAEAVAILDEALADVEAEGPS